MNIYTIQTEDVNGEPLELDICRPSGKQIQDAQLIYSSEWRKAGFDKKLIFRAAVNEEAKSQGIWAEAKDAKRDEISKRINKNRMLLRRGGVKFVEGEKAARAILKDIRELNRLMAPLNEMDGNTAEAYAENVRLTYLIAACTKDSRTGDPYFKDLEDYLSRDKEKAAQDATVKFMQVIYDVADEREDTPEIAFLKRFRLMNDKEQFLNKEGKAVDEDGKLINEKGEWINPVGELVDRDGNRIDDKGEYVVEFEPFLDAPSVGEDELPANASTREEDKLVAEPVSA